jgi:glyoxylase-like metal-dependent hydrolase (beta-lactamase superfamily II)
MSSQYEIHAIKYAEHMRKSSSNFLGGDPHDVDMPLNYFVWVIRNSERTIMVDTGFDRAMAARRGRAVMRPVEEGLAALGVNPNAVQDVIITHMHYDHAGNHDLFPAARYHLQEREMAFATGPCMCHKGMRLAFEVDDVVAMVRRVYQDRVSFCLGPSREVAPGIEVHRIGGHTAGLQVVRVATRAGWVVLASDASHYYANMEQDRSHPIVHNHFDMLQGFKTIRELAASPKHIVPGHDPLVLQRYPASLPGSDYWIVRLDNPAR